MDIEEKKARDRARQRAYYAKNKEAVRAAHAKYRAENREASRAYQAKYRAENREKCIASSLRWAANNPEKNASYNKKWRDSLFEQIQEILGKECTICGKEYHSAAMDIHHMVPELKSKGSNMYRRLLKPENKKELETCLMLCANCHRTLHATEKEMKKKIKTSVEPTCA